MITTHNTDHTKSNKYSKLIYRHTEGKYKDGVTKLIDKKISANNDDGLVIKLVNKINKNVDTTYIKYNPNNDKGYYIIEHENNNEQTKHPSTKEKITFDQLIERIKSNNLLKFVIDYFINIKENGGEQAC